MQLRGSRFHKLYHPVAQETRHSSGISEMISLIGMQYLSAS